MRFTTILIFITLSVHAQVDHWIGKASAANQKGLYDSVEYYYQKAQGTAKQKGENENYFLVMIFRAKNMIDQGKYHDAITLARVVETESETWAGIRNYYQGWAYDVIGNAELKKGNYQAAIDQFFDAELIFQKNDQWKKQLPVVYMSTGNAMRDKGSYAMAIEYFNRASNQSRDRGDAINEYIAQLNIAGCLVLQEKYDEAIALFNKGIDFFKSKLGESHPAFGTLYNNLGAAIFYQGRDYPLSLEYFNKGNEIKIKLLGENHLDVARGHFNIGWANEEMKVWEAAESHYNKAEAIIKKIFPLGHPLAAWTHNRHGILLMKQKKFELALSQLGIAEKQNTYRGGKEKLYFDKIRAVETSQFAAKVYYQWYKKSKNVEYLKSSLKYLMEAEAKMKMAYQQTQKESDQLELGKIGRTIYEMGVEVCYALVQATKDDGFSNSLFHFSEGGKAVVLNHALVEMQAMKFAGVPDSIIRQEHEHRQYTAEFTEKLLNFNPSTQPESERKDLEDVLFKLSAMQKMFLEKVSEQYPRYFELKYQAEALSLRQLQSSLPSGRAIISYMQTDSLLFVNIITDTSSQVVSTSSKPIEIERLVMAMRTGILFQTKEIYVQAASKLYSKLFPNGVPPSIKEITIIPDSRLIKIPFEALLINQPEPSSGFDKFDFLIKKITISYANSAQLYYQRLQEKSLSTKYGLLAMAPVFEKGKSKGMNLRTRTWLNESNKVMQADKQTRGNIFNGDDIAPLPATADEITSLYKLFESHKLNAEVVIGPIANERKLKKSSLSEFKYIHIATHGFVNEESPELSGLLLSQDTSDHDEDNVLYMGEIFNLNLKADLVTLSACETGLGKIIEGEGVVGLTRALTFAGARNILVSLWKVNDASTAQLMIYFYQSLLQNPHGPISSALQSAKMQVIKEGKFADPYYWSPFVLIGK